MAATGSDGPAGTFQQDARGTRLVAPRSLHRQPRPRRLGRISHKALGAGINLIDTSGTHGQSEVAVGKALTRRRDSVLLATKFSRPIDDPNHQGATRRWIMTAVDRLQDVPRRR